MTCYFHARAAFDLLAQSSLTTPESYFSLLFFTEDHFTQFYGAANYTDGKIAYEGFVFMAFESQLQACNNLMIHLKSAKIDSMNSV